MKSVEYHIIHTVAYLPSQSSTNTQLLLNADSHCLTVDCFPIPTRSSIGIGKRKELVQPLKSTQARCTLGLPSLTFFFAVAHFLAFLPKG